MNPYSQKDDGKEEISLALLIQRSANEFEQVLDFYDFLLFSAISAAEEGASKKYRNQ